MKTMRTTERHTERMDQSVYRQMISAALIYRSNTFLCGPDQVLISVNQQKGHAILFLHTYVQVICT